MEINEYLFIALSFLFLLFTTTKMLRSLYLLLLQTFNAQPRYRNIKPVYKPYLARYFKFYNALNEQDKNIFERRVQFFIDLKTFIPRGGLRVVPAEIKALIAGSAIQITYGYPNVYFRYFSRILVYPNSYLNKLTKQYHKGEVNLKGIIVLSIKSLTQGWVNDADGINLGLHEMAHALGIENLVKNEEFNFIDQSKVRVLKELARPEMTKINSGMDTIFRKYGGANFREFFSVATEVFFEIPGTFKIYHQQMYNTMTKILNIDPAEVYANSKQ